jgi:hypothetical protein
MNKFLLTLSSIFFATQILAQKSDKTPRYFEDPIITDSSSTLLIPIRYNSGAFSSNKLALWGDYYANIIFFDFKNNTSKRLFDTDTFIRGFYNNDDFYRRTERSKNIKDTSKQWLFLFVTTNDYDQNDKINSDDPAVLYVTDLQGNQLKALTPANENAQSINIYEDQGFALVKMQRDSDKDHNFEYDDRDFYYIRLDLKTLELSTKIEIK